MAKSSEGWVLRVLSLGMEGAELRLRVGLVNDSKSPRNKEPEFGGGKVRLSSVTGSLETDLEWMPGGRDARAEVEPGAAWVRELRCAWAEDKPVTGLPFTLHCPGFMPVTFAVSHDDRLGAAIPAASGEAWPLNFEEPGIAESMANIPLVLREARVKEGRLEIGVAFRNASRFDLDWKGRMTGAEARLWTREGEALPPDRVSDGLEDGIGPQRWRSGEENSGTISFPLPPPMGGQELAFVFPGYPPVNLLFDAKEKRWVVAPRAMVQKPDDAAELARAEEALFRELAAFWKTMSVALEERDFATYLGAFANDRELRAGLPAFLGGLGTVPVTWLEFVLPPRQRLISVGGQVRRLEVELRYRLAGIPRGNEFVAVMECDMERVLSDRSWIITAMKHRLRPPFWTLGFTEVKSSPHFLVFHQKNVSDSNRAQSALTQLEAGYSHLVGEGLPLGARYVAFVIPDGRDFEALTGRNPTIYSGASSATYVERNGELQVINQALFINDQRFFSLQRLMGRQDRKITIQHELVHLAFADQTRPWTPAWLVEGMAVVFGGQMEDIASRAPAEPEPEDVDLAALSQLPTLGVGAQGGGRVLSQYLASARAVEWLLDQKGKSALLSFYASFARLEPDEWRSSGDGVRTQTATEPPEMQAARLRLAKEMMRKHLSGMALEELNAAAGAE